MRLLDRYLLRELLAAVAVCLCAFTLLWITGSLLSDLHKLQDAHLRGKEVVEYYVLSFPEFVPIALPVSLLLALLYAITNHARYNEITAMRAAGISLARLSLPYFVVGLLASVALFALNELYGAKAADAAEEILAQHAGLQLKPVKRGQIQNLIFVTSSAGGEERKWSAAIYNTKTHEMRNVKVQSTPTNGGPSFLLSADTAVWTNHAWNFVGNVEEDLNSNGGSERILKTTNALAMPAFTETPKEIQSELSIKNYRGHLNTRTHSADIPLSDIVNYLRLHPNLDRKTRNWLYTKLHGRFAGPCACLVAVLVAIPFAAGSGRRNVFVGVATSISIFFAYFVLQQVGFSLGEAGWLPAWFGAWFPNLFFAITALVMMSKVR